MTAIGVVAQVVAEDFNRFYDVFMPLAKSVIAAAATDKSLGSLRNKALETLSLICEAVGKEKSGMDAAEVMNTLVRAQHNGLTGDDTEGYHYVMSSIARLANCLGADFAPYLPFVMPRLLESAGRSVEVTVTDAEDVPPAAGGAAADGSAGGGGMTQLAVDIAGVGSRRVALDSAALEEKSISLSVLVSFVDDLGVDVTAFRPYIDPAAKVICESMASPFASVRQLGASGVRGILLAGLSDVSDLGHAQRVLEGLLGPVLTCLLKERDSEARQTLGEALCEVMRVCHESTTDGLAVDVAIPAQAVGSGGRSGDEPAPHTKAIVPFNGLERVLMVVQKAIEECAARREDAKKAFGRNPDADEEEVAHFESE